MNIQVLLRMGVVVGGGRRGLSSGRACLSRTAIRRMLLQDNSNGRKKNHMHFGLPAVEEAATPTKGHGDKKKKMPKNSRLRALNKVYLDKITDILSTGELASQLCGRGLELSEVCVLPNLQGINVYWMTTGSPEQDTETETLLHTHAKTVRHELSSLRVIGHSPPIAFVRDDRHFKLAQVERLLDIADFGEDFEPSNPGHHLKADLPTLTMPLHHTIKATIEDLKGHEDQEAQGEHTDPFEEAVRIVACEAAIDDAAPELPGNLPTLRTDVLGLNTARIYDTVQQSMKRARAEHRKQAEEDCVEHLHNLHLQETESAMMGGRKRDIEQWARQYRQMQRKEARSQNKEAALLRYPENLNIDHLQGQEEIEIKWVEEDYDDDLE